MLFDTKEFEQFFKEKSLTKGLKLFEKAKVHFQEKQADSTYLFVIDDSIHIKVKKKADSILSYRCECNHTQFCEHLSAVLFYFQKDVLGISAKGDSAKIKKTIQKKTGELGNKKFKLFLNEIEVPQLIDFIDTYAGENVLFKELLESHFSGRSEKNCLKYYQIQLKLILSPFSDSQQLTQKQLSEVLNRVKTLVNKVSLLKNEFNDLFFLRLALVNSLPKIIEKRNSGNNLELTHYYHDNFYALDSFFKDGLTTAEAHAWIEITEQSIKNNSILNSEAYCFLIPRAAIVIKDLGDFRKLKSLLAKRSHRSFYTDYFNKLMIAELQLAIKASELVNEKFATKNYDEEPELSIALADLSFCEGKIENGFGFLNNFYEKAKQSKFYSGYLDFIIQKANEYKQPQIEIAYLKESIINRVYIYPKHLERLYELIPSIQVSSQIDELITEIRKNKKNNLFDKVAILLIKENRWDDLINEIKHQFNKFLLLNEVALKKLPNYDQDLLTLYAKHFLEAIQDEKASYYQEHIFNEAKKYILQLPAEDMKNLIATILFKIGKGKQIYKYIKNTFAFAEEIEKHKPAKLGIIE